MLGYSHSAFGSFSKPVDDLISYLAPQHHFGREEQDRDYPWRRLAYDRTLSCPDLARVVNDFLSPDFDFASNDDVPVQLCA